MKDPQILTLTTTSLHNVGIFNTSDGIYYQVVTRAQERTTISRFEHDTCNFNLVAEVRNDLRKGRWGWCQSDGAGGGDDAREGSQGRARLGKPVGVSLYGGALVDPREFLKVLPGAEGGASWRAARFKGKDGKMYTWRVGKRGRLALFRENKPETEPVAVYHRHKRHFFVLRMSRHPYLEVDAAALDTLDSLILSFLLIERRRRDKACWFSG